MPEEPSGYKPNGSYKVFPIDYSLNELGTKWNVDPRTIKKYVLNNNYLKKPLSDLSKSLADLDQEKQPLAVETEPFLKSFFKLATSTKDFKALCQGKERKPGSKSKISKMFCYKLCINMCRDICAPSETDDIDAAKFCRRVLFRNDKFNAAVMRQEWSSQIKLRIDQIQQLSQTIPAEQQALALQDCLMELDHICLTLIQPNNWSNRVFFPFMHDLHQAHPELPSLTPHELRHTRATLWIAQGISPLMVARLLGHCDVKMLTRVYDHTTVDTLREAITSTNKKKTE